MSRPVKKTVYERIEMKEEEIKRAEENLIKLNNELQDLCDERDQLEMNQLFATMREKGLTVKQAISMMSTSK